MSELLNIKTIAIHEAAHAVVQYRASGHADSIAIVVSEDGIFGSALEGETSDSDAPEHVEPYIVSVYAGGFAQRKMDPATGSDGCDGDEEIAERLLHQWQWQDRAQAFRDRAQAMVDAHWAEIQAVACELLRNHQVQSTQVEAIADETAAASGHST